MVYKSEYYNRSAKTTRNSAKTTRNSAKTTIFNFNSNVSTARNKLFLISYSIYRNSQTLPKHNFWNILFDVCSQLMISKSWGKKHCNYRLNNAGNTRPNEMKDNNDTDKQKLLAVEYTILTH
jgi:hypothetical protein